MFRSAREASGCGVSEVLAWILARKTEENHTTASVRIT